jgi:hypothetical protein
MTSKETAKKIEGATTCGSSTPAAPNGQAKLKVKLQYRLLAFAGAVLGLSWFFEGSRQIAEAVNFSSVGYLLLGTFATVVFMGILSFWIYVEEKSKGTLKVRFGLFEKIYAKRLAKTQQITESTTNGSQAIREGD